MAECMFAGLSQEREAIVAELRTLSAELDEIDRQVGDLAWRREPIPAELTSEQAGLTARLRRLAGRLHRLDQHLSAF